MGGVVPSGLVELARSVFTIQSLWMQTNMEPGSTINAVRSSRVLLGQELHPAVVIIEDGKIKQIQPHSADIACEVTNIKKTARTDHIFQIL